MRVELLHFPSENLTKRPKSGLMSVCIFFKIRHYILWDTKCWFLCIKENIIFNAMFLSMESLRLSQSSPRPYSLPGPPIVPPGLDLRQARLWAWGGGPRSQEIAYSSKNKPLGKCPGTSGSPGSRWNDVRVRCSEPPFPTHGGQDDRSSNSFKWVKYTFVEI